MDPTHRLLLANVCTAFKDLDSVIDGTTHALKICGYDLTHTKIHGIDGIKNGESVQALIISTKHSKIVKNHTWVFVVIRGSGLVEKEKWILQQRPELVCMTLDDDDYYPPVPTNCFGKIRRVMVHSGLLRGYRSIQADIRKSIREAPATSTMIFGGYGVGGAIAQLAALDNIVRNIRDPYHRTLPVECCVFNSPRVGNVIFKRRFEIMIPVAERWIYGNDEISALPVSNQYYHTGHLHIIDPITLKPSYKEKSEGRRVGSGCLFWGWTPEKEHHDVGKILAYLRIADKETKEKLEKDGMD
jgi:hypothetical protein